MTQPTFLERLSNTTLLANGAMGTMLHTRGVGFDKCFDELNLTNPSAVAEIHREHIEAGTQLIITNTSAASWDSARNKANATRGAIPPSQFLKITSKSSNCSPPPNWNLGWGFPFQDRSSPKNPPPPSSFRTKTRNITRSEKRGWNS